MRLCLLSVVFLAFALPAKAVCVECACSVTAPTLSFGTYTPGQPSPTDSSRQVQVSCSGPAGLLVGYQIALSAGGSGTYSPRRMQSGANTLAYNIYRDGGYSQVWGDGTGGSSTVSDVIALILLGTSSKQNTAYGRLFAQQNVAPGAYADTVTVTVTY